MREAEPSSSRPEQTPATCAQGTDQVGFQRMSAPQVTMGRPRKEGMRAVGLSKPVSNQERMPTAIKRVPSFRESVVTVGLVQFNI